MAMSPCLGVYGHGLIPRDGSEPISDRLLYGQHWILKTYSSHDGEIGYFLHVNDIVDFRR